MSKTWTERLVLAVIYLLLISFAATASYFIADQAMRMLNTILVLEETHAASVIRLFLTVIISGMILAAVSYWEGYHFASFEKGIVFPAIGMSLAVHFLLGFLFGFSPWVTGGALYLAGWIKYGADYTSECSVATKDVSVLIFIGAFLVFAALYTLFMSLPQYYGKIKRYADREALLEEHSRRTTYVQPSDEYDKTESKEDGNDAKPL
ncbi:MAG: hypothetical protein IIX86_01655 [Clostridia bacterium]|nr:hypothetical protein [Clostridia bacterium]